MSKPHLQIIIGSTRPGRRGGAVGNWFYNLAVRHDKFGVELIDLAEVNLPLLDEPLQPGAVPTPRNTPGVGAGPSVSARRTSSWCPSTTTAITRRPRMRWPWRGMADDRVADCGSPLQPQADRHEEKGIHDSVVIDPIVRHRGRGTEQGA
jgi:hypothetical protein